MSTNAVGTVTPGDTAPGNANRNKNLKNLNINVNTTNKAKFATAFKSAADLSTGARFPEIAEKCSVIANTLDTNTSIDLSSTFGNYGPNKTPSNTAAANLNKVKTFTGSANAPTRGVILIKILSEIKDLVKKRRNLNNKVASNIKTVENFNKAIINLINAVNKAKKGNTPAASANAPAANAANAAKKAYANAENKSAAVKAYANAINAYASGVNVPRNNLNRTKASYNMAPTNQNMINQYAAAINAYANAVKAKKNQGNVSAAQ